MYTDPFPFFSRSYFSDMLIIVVNETDPPTTVLDWWVILLIILLILAIILIIVLVIVIIRKRNALKNKVSTSQENLANAGMMSVVICCVWKLSFSLLLFHVTSSDSIDQCTLRPCYFLVGAC